MGIQWSLVLFTALANAGSVLFACVGINEFKALTRNQKSINMACIFAILLLAAGGLCSVTRVSHLDRILVVLTHPAPGIFTDTVMIASILVLVVLYFVLLMRRVNPSVRKVVAALGILLGIAFPFSCGASYMVSSHAAWNTFLLPLSYLGTALPVGISAWLGFSAMGKKNDEAVKFNAILLLAGSLIALAITASYGYVSGVALGSNAIWFWALVIAVGCLVPLLIAVVLMRKSNGAMLLACVAFICAAAGAIAFRALMWVASTGGMSLLGTLM